MMDENYIFEKSKEINTQLSAGNENKARNLTIRLLSELKANGEKPLPVVNHLVRSLGLYPYIDTKTASWQDQVAFEAFKVDVGEKEARTLHRAQSYLLKKLLQGTDVAVSAPTSFGKSFIVDSFIALTKPQNVVIIVPTIALTDETRRRLYRKFSTDYTIITTPEVALGARNILIFPQERVFGYLDKIQTIDFLIVDEFYKAEPATKDERANILLKAIIELSKKAKQRYYLAPNISDVEENPFTKGMEFVKIDFNTVVTEFHENYKEFDSENQDEQKKECLLSILKERDSKTLVYAGSHSQTNEVLDILIGNLPNVDTWILNAFSEWLKENYSEDYKLVQAVLKGVGIHNGRIHRSLSQLQVKLFEKAGRLNTLVSTSSIIEGVNTSAENVVLWSNRNGSRGLTSFAYNNIAGRGGRMFQYFVGRVFNLVEPPAREPKSLKLDFPDDVLVSIDVEKHKQDLTREQIIKIVAFSEEVDEKVGTGTYNKLISAPELRGYTGFQIRGIVSELIENESAYSSLPYLLSDDVQKWNSPLRDCYYHLSHMDLQHWQFIRFVKILSQNWTKTIPELLAEFEEKKVGVGIDNFFEYERRVAYDLSNMLGQVNSIMRYIRPKSKDISPFIFKASHAFLPKLVYELEEYGLPRMISRKIQNKGIIDLEHEDVSVNDILLAFKDIGCENLAVALELSKFETYILTFFFQGITAWEK